MKKGISTGLLHAEREITHPNSEHNLHPNRGVFGLVTRIGSEDVGHSSIGGVMVDASGRANAHTSAAPFRRPPEVSGGGNGVGELGSVAVSPGGRGPNPPTEEEDLFEGVVRFLFLGLLVGTAPELEGGPRWG